MLIKFGERLTRALGAIVVLEAPQQKSNNGKYVESDHKAHQTHFHEHEQ
jgi:hypothetical protein